MGGLVSPRDVLPARKRVEKLVQVLSDELYYINDVLMCHFHEVHICVCVCVCVVVCVSV